MKQSQKYIIGILFTVLFFSSSIALPSGFSQGNILAFKFSITTATSPDTFALPLEVGGTYNFIVMWGDGTNNTITVWNQAEVTHTYATKLDLTGTTTVTIYEIEEFTTLLEAEARIVELGLVDNRPIDEDELP